MMRYTRVNTIVMTIAIDYSTQLATKTHITNTTKRRHTMAITYTLLTLAAVFSVLKGAAIKRLISKAIEEDQK